MDTKVLRQKILDLAIRGKLVPQDPNDEPASVLLERIRQQKQQMVKEGKLKPKDIKNDSAIFVGEDNLHYEKFADGSVKCIEDEIPFDLPEGWAWARLNQIYNFIDYRGATPNKISSGVPLITAKNVKSGYIDYTIDEYISEEEYWDRQQRGTSRLGDVLFTTEAPLGNAAIADIEKFSAGQRLITFQHYGSCVLNNHTFLYFILSDFFQDQLHTRKTGSTVAGIKASILKTLLLPIPPIAEQDKIGEKCENLLAVIEEITNSKQSIISAIPKTKAKILDLAIRGKLVPQDPNDEPASVLLERIRAEKEELIKQGKIKRDKKESVIFRGEDNSYYLNNGTSAIDTSAELPFDIPASWCWGKLKDIVMINPRNKLDDNTDVAFIPMPLIEDGYSGHHTSEIRKWKEVKTGFTHFQEGDVGVAKITPCFENRKSVIFENLNNGYGAGTTELYVFRPYGKTILPQYLLAYMKSAQFIENGKHSFAGAVGQQRVSKEYVENVYFPIPPIDEQKRIVHQLTIAFEYLNVISDALT